MFLLSSNIFTPKLNLRGKVKARPQYNGVEVLGVLAMVKQKERLWSEGFLICTIQARPSANFKQCCISLEIADPVIHPSIIRDSTLKSAIYNVSCQPKTCCPIGCNIFCCGHISPNHHIVTRGLWLLFSHPKPKSCSECCYGVVRHYLWVSQAIKPQGLPSWPIVVIPAMIIYMLVGESIFDHNKLS